MKDRPRGGRAGDRAHTGDRDRGSRPGRRRNADGERGRPERDGGVLVGWHPVLEALRSGNRSISKVLLAAERHDARAGEVARLAREAGVPVQHLPAQALARVVPHGVPHQGVAAEVAPQAYVDASQLLAGAGPRALFVLLDEVQDPRNLGAIARTAAAVGATGLLLPLHRSASVTAAAEKASAGALAHLPVARVANLAKILEKMGEMGFERVGLDGRANDLYTTIPGDRPLAIVLGGEERGLRPIVRAACDRLVRIPIPGAVESLNVSIAAALALYEVLRARSQTMPT